MSILITFDIDGTLINCTNGRNIQQFSFLSAFQYFFQKKIEIKDLFDQMYVGITDSSVSKGIFKKHKGNFTPKEIDLFLNKYNEFFLNSILEKPIVLPGIINILEKLNKKNDIIIGVATGNTFETAKFKLEKAQIFQYFQPLIGGFGEQDDRGPCVHQAQC